MKNLTLNLIIILTTLSLSGCISTEAIKRQLGWGLSPKHASNSCFDIGSGFNTSFMTDDYFEELEVTDGISCVKALADRGPYTDEERAAYIYDVLTVSLNKSFLSDDVLKAIRSESKSYQNLINELITKRTLRESVERDIIRVKEKAIRDALNAENSKKRTKLCGKNRSINKIEIGDNEACLLQIMGWPDDVNTTTTKYNTSKQYVFRIGRDTTFVYTTDGAITAIQE